jgi:hypothetical protein
MGAGMGAKLPVLRVNELKRRFRTAYKRVARPKTIRYTHIWPLAILICMVSLRE